MNLMGTSFATMEHIKWDFAKAELRKIAKEASAGASDNGKIYEKSACVRKGPMLKVIT
jgi:hypothetical protein